VEKRGKGRKDRTVTGLSFFTKWKGEKRGGEMVHGGRVLRLYWGERKKKGESRRSLFL